MQSSTFTLGEFIKNENSDSYEFLSKQGKLFIFYEFAIIKQGMFKGRSMNYTLSVWLQNDAKLVNLANKESDKILVLALYGINDFVQDKINALKETIRKESEQNNYFVGSVDMSGVYVNYKDGSLETSEYDEDIAASISFPLEPEEVMRRIRYVNDLLADGYTLDMLNDWEVSFLHNACAVVKLTTNQRQSFQKIQSKINRIRAARL